MWALWIILGGAFAQDVVPHKMLHDALVLEGLHGDLEGSVQRYRLLVRNTSMDDATRARALIMLGRALYDLGEVEEAREALFEGRASGVCNAQCVTLLQALVIEQEAVREIPAVWDFERTDHGFFHPFALQDQGAIRLARYHDDNGVLEWETTPPLRGRDQLVVGLTRPSPPPREVELSVTSAAADVGLVVSVEDELGRRWALAEPLLLPRGERVRATVSFSSLRSTSEGPSVTLDRRRLTRVALESVAPRGVANVLFLHEFAIR